MRSWSQPNLRQSLLPTHKDAAENLGRFNTTVLHSPKSANFKTRRWNYIAICSGAICGNADRIDNLVTVRQTLSNYGNRAGKRLTVAVGITQTTVANTIQTGKKTADCLGRTGTDRRCKYIY